MNKILMEEIQKFVEPQDCSRLNMLVICKDGHQARKLYREACDLLLILEKWHECVDGAWTIRCGYLHQKNIIFHDHQDLSRTISLRLEEVLADGAIDLEKYNQVIIITRGKYKRESFRKF